MEQSKIDWLPALVQLSSWRLLASSGAESDDDDEEEEEEIDGAHSLSFNLSSDCFLEPVVLSSGGWGL